jgi:DNA-binding NarL/FixJ family response regulator
VTRRRPRCLLADDHPALLAAVGALLTRGGFELVGPAANGVEALAVARAERPDLAVLDYRMPGLTGAELIARLRAEVPSTRAVVYTADADEVVVRDAFAAGAGGIVLKEAPLADLVRALETVLAGRSYVDPALARTAVEVTADESVPSLTARELDVLRLLAEGLSHDQIGGRLAISSETVRTHVRKATRRLGASTRTHAVATALRLGVIN